MRISDWSSDVCSSDLRAVADVGAPAFEVPTGNGFCMYIRRAMLEDVGLFDEQAFPVGYGEENDLCMRAIDAGWHHLVDQGRSEERSEGKECVRMCRSRWSP